MTETVKHEGEISNTPVLTLGRGRGNNIDIQYFLFYEATPSSAVKKWSYKRGVGQLRSVLLSQCIPDLA